ncbi:hypothetical protein H0H92_006252 [Tricholoma furcatifolium]|nr:hypothetical protein H0H92_006252 [Tricholoma furcatifolium]
MDFTDVKVRQFPQPTVKTLRRIEEGLRKDKIRYLVPPQICDVEGGVFSIRRPRYEDNILKTASSTRPFLPVAEALAYLHERHIAHGHVHPDNIFLSKGEAVVVDACIYSHARASMPPGNIWIPEEISTLYQSPEFLDASQTVLAPPSDVYAFGTIIYAVLTGHNPWGADPQNSTSVDKAFVELKSSGHGCIFQPDSIEKPLWDLIQTCWSSKPEERPTMKDIIGSLTDIQLYGTVYH